MKNSFALVKTAVLIAVVVLIVPWRADGSTVDEARWAQEARNVTIVRDDWGIAHVYGKTDADAVFGMIYAQAEDDFNRVETNYLNAMGRLAETEGESKVYQDLRMKMFIDPAALKKEYAASPQWLKKLMNAFADGVNFYLAKHPEVKPRVIQHFEPWMVLSFTEGQHRGRHRTRGSEKTGGILRRRAEGGSAGGAARRGAGRIEWNCDCALEHGESTRAAADQSAYFVFLSLGVTDGQRSKGSMRMGR